MSGIGPIRWKTTANLSYDQKCSPFGDLTNVSHDLKLLSLVQRLRLPQPPASGVGTVAAVAALAVTLLGRKREEIPFIHMYTDTMYITSTRMKCR